MANKHGLPKRMQRTPDNKILLKHSVFDMKKGKTKSKSLGTYPTVELAVEAQELAISLTGTTPASRKKVRISVIEEAINNFRLNNGLKAIKTNA